MSVPGILLPRKPRNWIDYLGEIELVKVDLEYLKSARSATDRYVAQITVQGQACTSSHGRTFG